MNRHSNTNRLATAAATTATAAATTATAAPTTVTAAATTKLAAAWRRKWVLEKFRECEEK
ncbi:hypothetical protein TIFTF001_050735 [Ficus carica]|uniref:Uncharacterized protein n=1 Tax=Ficus carica TaxID=3494 RepID=A0AA88CV28_FICCA|nr:hypothetical protein TIFTF001_050735 [Ficus carica]